MAVVIRPKYINLTVTELSKNCVHVVFQTLEEEVAIEHQVLKGTAGRKPVRRKSIKCHNSVDVMPINA